MIIGSSLAKTFTGKIKRATALFLAVAVAFSSDNIYAYAGEYNPEHEHTHEHVAEVCMHENTRNVEIQHATCVKPAVFNSICEKCGIIVERNVSGTVVDRTNHTAFTRTVIKDSTDLSEGIAKFTCNDCGYSYTRAIAKKPCLHRRTIVRENLSDATCVSAKTADLVCKDCGTVLKDDYLVEDVNPNHHSSFTESTTQAPTTEAAGTKTYTCDDCGYSYTEEIPKLCDHHNTSEAVTKAATDKEEGLKTITCTDCGYSYTETIAKVTCSHRRTKYYEKTPADCAHKAVGELKCLECGEVVNDHYEKGKINPSNHASFTSEITKAATVRESGIKTTTCEFCGYSYTEELAPLECTHENTTFQANRVATCTQKATGKLICADCGYIVSKRCEYGEVDSTNHYYKSEITKKATYHEEGEKLYTCTRCGDSYTESIPKKQCTHNRTTFEVVTPATCNTSAIGKLICLDCDAVVNENESRDFGSGDHVFTVEITRKPTPYLYGIKTYTCEVCGYRMFASIPECACEHTNTKFVQKAGATCSSKARGEIWCLDCGDVVNFYGEWGDYNPEAHSEYDVTVTKEPTIFETGIRTYTCRHCGYSYTEEIEKLVCRHSYTEFTEMAAADCIHKARGILTCTDCGVIVNANAERGSKNSSKHNAMTSYVSKEPTYDAYGTKTYVCEDCGYTKNERIDKLVCEHTDTEFVVTKEGSCSERAVGNICCTECGKVMASKQTGEFNPSNHRFLNETVTKEPTVYEEGSKTIKCSSCGYTVTEVIAKKEMCETHSHVSEKITKAATFKEEGSKTITCKDCGYTYTEVIPKEEVCLHPSKKEYRDFEELTPATCTHYARGNVICNLCGEVLARDYENRGIPLDPYNHEEYVGTVTKEPTYKAAGVMTYTCTGCGDKFTVEIAKLDCPHDNVFYTVKDSKSWIRCEDCGEYLRQHETTPEACKHTGYAKEERIIKATTSTEDGIIQRICSNCGEPVAEITVHAYSTYTIINSDGVEETIYGWFDNDWAYEVWRLTNEYRVANGLNELSYNYSLQEASNLRALEIVVKWSHTRPNGQKWTTVCSQWQYGGENLASGQKTPEYTMTAWKNSPGHNANLLYGIESGQTKFKRISVGVFHRFLFSDLSSTPHVPVQESLYWSQNFTFTVYP